MYKNRAMGPKKPVWEMPKPKNAAHHTMTPAQKQMAANIARAHGTKVGLADRLAAIKKIKK